MTETLATAENFKIQVGTGSVYEMRAPSFSGIYLKNTPKGQPIRDALKQHTRDVLKLFRPLKEKSDGKNIVVLDIPRGGVPSAEETFDFVKNNTAPASLSHVSSNIKTSFENLFPEEIDFSTLDTLIIVDAVVATGKTVCDHLNQIPDNFKGTVVLVSNATAEMGVRSFNESLIVNGLKGYHISGGVIPDEDCIMKVIDGKEVYIVGLGDIGDAVSVDPVMPRTRKTYTAKPS